jgi:starvation-inducible outer membrane lipoprotein
MCLAGSVIMINMRRMLTIMGSPAIWLAASLLLLSGCAGPNVQDISLVDSSASPETVRGNLPAYKDRTVQWGGLIVGIVSDQSPILLDVLSYPLDDFGNPEESNTATGRFFVELPASFAPSEYRVGLFVTVVGSIKREIPVRTGEVENRLPVLGQVGIYLWDTHRRERQQVRPVFSFGLGVRL